MFNTIELSIFNTQVHRVAMNRISILSLIFVQCFICGCIARQAEQSCTLDVDNGLPKSNQPLILTPNGKHYSLASPEKIDKDSVIKLLANSEVLLVCPGVGNELRTTQKDTVSTTCQRNELQTSRGRQIIKGTNNFSCTRQITPLIRKIDHKCGNNSQANIYEIGYFAEKINTWITMFTVCHDAVNMNTLYSVNTIDGKSIEARQKNVPRPSDFMAGNLPELYEGKKGWPNLFYTGKSQLQKFRELFKTGGLKHYINLYEKKFLSRGHLTPDADMSLQSWKVATYMYINVAPQWQNINAGNWLKIENKVRDAAIWSKNNFTIITGTYGVMKLPLDQTEQEIYLAPGNKLRVPEQFWKVVYHERSKSAIVLITSNNPYIPVPPLCNDVCKTSLWSHENFQGDENLGRGQTYCCTYVDFRHAVTDDVPLLKVERTYSMPKKPLLARLQSGIKRVTKNNRKGMWDWKQKVKQD